MNIRLNIQYNNFFLHNLQNSYKGQQIYLQLHKKHSNELKNVFVYHFKYLAPSFLVSPYPLLFAPLVFLTFFSLFLHPTSMIMFILAELFSIIYIHQMLSEIFWAQKHKILDSNLDSDLY